MIYDKNSEFSGRREGCEVDPERVGRGEEGGGDGTCSILTDLSSLHLLRTGARLHWIGGVGLTQGRSRFLNVIPCIKKGV